MFTKLLIANRGEIACRVMDTARRMGMATVAVYSDADAAAKHVAMADEAVRIGTAPVADSYLQGARIIQAALDRGAQAIHPGYGFLSENPAFVEAVEAAGLVFVGPTADAIRAMGLKDAAKARVAQAGVPTVPGYHGAAQDADTLAAQAAKIGYPVMIKARAGGGGKGMRLVADPSDFAESLAAAAREGAASFGDPACLIEKFIQNPRHIEVQVFGDAQGRVVHLFERDCSLQRRHQKVIEEAPAPGMTPQMRAAMGQAAVDAAKAIGYQGAGTVEFIVDGTDGLRADRFWFMEMNTRLQVEHPVSEAITGLDFVELQLRIAAGEGLPFAQEDIAIAGHAIEARIYAEDVPRGFLPAIGRVEHLHFPDGARIDSGVRQGDSVSPWYDPMIAKLTVHAPTRDAALGQLRRALAASQVAGLSTNLGFLGRLAAHRDFADGHMDTGLIGRDLAELTAEPEAAPSVWTLAGLVALGVFDFGALAGWRIWGRAEYCVTLNGRALRIADLGGGRYACDGAEVGIAPQIVRQGAGQYHVNGRRVSAVRTRAGVTVFDSGETYGFERADPLDTQTTTEGGDAVLAPMPGVVKQVSAKPGQTVEAGAALMVLEAMKMEHVLRAPRAGVVAEVPVQTGDQVTDGALMLRLEAEA